MWASRDNFTYGTKMAAGIISIEYTLLALPAFLINLLIQRHSLINSWVWNLQILQKLTLPNHKIVLFFLFVLSFWNRLNKSICWNNYWVSEVRGAGFFFLCFSSLMFNWQINDSGKPRKPKKKVFCSKCWTIPFNKNDRHVCLIFISPLQRFYTLY